MPGMVPNVELKAVGGMVNFLEWKREWFLCLSSYGLAGKEILENRSIRILQRRPSANENQVYDPIYENGILQIVARRMTGDKRASLPKMQTDWNKAQAEYD
jgi:hypothetical protein